VEGNQEGLGSILYLKTGMYKKAKRKIVVVKSLGGERARRSSGGIGDL
jgi:hypothetical protein